MHSTGSNNSQENTVSKLVGEYTGKGGANQNMPSVENTIFSLLSNLTLSDGDCDRLERLLFQVEDKNAFIARTRYEGLEGMLYRHAIRCGTASAFDVDQQQQLRFWYHQAAARNTANIYELRRILESVAHSRPRIVILQGMDLLHCLYKDVGLRPMEDIDLWVLPERFDRFSRQLMDLGYARNSNYSHIFQKRGTTLDVHTHIMWADRIKSRALLLSKSQRVVYRDAEKFSLEGLPAMRLGPYDRALYLMLHVLKHCADRLIWLVDLKLLVTAWNVDDWRCFVSRCEFLGQKKPVSYVLFLLERVLDYDLPAEMRSQLGLHVLTPLERNILKRGVENGVLPQWTPLLFLSTHNGLGSQLQYIFENFFPRPEILRQVFRTSPQVGVWKLYLMRVTQLFGKFLYAAVRRLPH
jgi:hypothetical protein